MGCFATTFVGRTVDVEMGVGLDDTVLGLVFAGTTTATVVDSATVVVVGVVVVVVVVVAADTGPATVVDDIVDDGADTGMIFVVCVDVFAVSTLVGGGIVEVFVGNILDREVFAEVVDEDGGFCDGTSEGMFLSTNPYGSLMGSVRMMGRDEDNTGT